MGAHTARLRSMLLSAGCIEQIVDLPQGIWPDANVDCVLLFLASDSNEDRRKAQQVRVNMLGLHDTLDKLTARDWTETLLQPQVDWMGDPACKIAIRYDALLQHIEEVCRVPTNGGSITKILRLNDITDSTQGIIPYHTKSEGAINLYIRLRHEVPPYKSDWKPLLDSTAFIGRYELRWGTEQPCLKYGDWLYSVPKPRFFKSPKLLVQDMRNRALKRRLVATYDDQKFYNRHNFSDIIAKDTTYDLKYILALFNSSLLNYWFARHYDNVHINPSYFRLLPIFPADAETQAVFVGLVDEILARYTVLNRLREDGYEIKLKRDGFTSITVPYDLLLQEVQTANPSFGTLTLFDAKAIGMFSIPDRCDLDVSVGSNVNIPDKYPTTVVLRYNQLWLEVPDGTLRRYLLSYFQQPRWQGKTWDEFKNTMLVPEDTQSLIVFFTAEARQKELISTILTEIKRLDSEIDERVLDLYSIIDVADRQRILGSAPIVQDEDDSDDR